MSTAAVAATAMTTSSLGTAAAPNATTAAVAAAIVTASVPTAVTTVTVIVATPPAAHENTPVGRCVPIRIRIRVAGVIRLRVSISRCYSTPGEAGGDKECAKYL